MGAVGWNEVGGLVEAICVFKVDVCGCLEISAAPLVLIVACFVALVF